MLKYLKPSLYKSPGTGSWSSFARRCFYARCCALSALKRRDSTTQQSTSRRAHAFPTRASRLEGRSSCSMVVPPGRLIATGWIPAAVARQSKYYRRDCIAENREKCIEAMG
uniref:Uncharacterized protein n=1 Tax=Hyaloperonospora arabidopsidis (strain Emoy2) TaxID=559515 RepID=M4BRZ2_HYAAE